MILMLTTGIWEGEHMVAKGPRLVKSESSLDAMYWKAH